MHTIQIVLATGIWAISSVASAQQISQGRADVGAIVFKQCMGCHQVGPSARNGIGPVLNGVVGRPAGVYAGYSYSSANKSSGLVPGTKMIYFGLKKSQDVADVVAYLKQFNGEGQNKSLKAERIDNQPSKREKNYVD
jgi:cytochrome c